MIPNDDGGPVTFKVFVLYIMIPYLLGFYYSKYNLELMHGKLQNVKAFLETIYEYTSSEPVRYSEASPEVCFHRLRVIMHEGTHVKRHDAPFQNVSVVLHSNGEAKPMGRTSIDIMEAFRMLFEKEGRCPLDFEKYQLDALLTRLFNFLLTESMGESTAVYKMCDRGEAYTPVLLDHDLLVPIEHEDGSFTLPCHFHSEHGIRIDTLFAFAQIARALESTTASDETCLAQENEECRDNSLDTATTVRELHIYAVPAGRVFMFAAEKVGQIIRLPHVTWDKERPVYLEVMSTQPRIFEVVNFFDRRDSDDLVERALDETREGHRIARSTTIVAETNDRRVNAKRTSESGFDTDGPTAVKLKKRGMKLLGFDEYIVSHTDGLQLLRYNKTTAYNSHFDWIRQPTDSEHNYDSGGVGGNRFATILLYMSDLGPNEGGQTIFPQAKVNVNSNETASQAVERLRESGALSDIVPGSWEEEMLGQCHTKFAVSPFAGKAILFYSQNPDGTKDPDSIHGACPVLAGDKWAANLWAWNTPRPGYYGSPKLEGKQMSSG